MDNPDNPLGDKIRYFVDPEEQFEKIIGGTWAPYRLCASGDLGPAMNRGVIMQRFNRLEKLYSVDVVFTSDKSKWSRCPVIEMGEDDFLSEGNVNKFYLRSRASIDKDGNPDGTGTGMGWFPGYAINVETGERLNVMYGEDSWLKGENGADMMFNPTSNYSTDLGINIWGGKHYLYIFGSYNSANNDQSPAYDEGTWAKTKLQGGNNTMRQLYKSIMWVSIPMLVRDKEFLSNEARVRIRVSKPYARNYGASREFNEDNPSNENWPLYEFTTYDMETKVGELEVAKNALDLINVVPNPYYSFSLYEETQVDNLVKITNLPQKCTISIFTVNGTLIRQFTKDDAETIVEWDLKNYSGIPISGGMYIIHVNAPGIGERTVKWFGSLRPLDLNSF